MYCPKCAAMNAEDSKYCRLCGTNLSLIPQALTGRIPVEPSEQDRYSRRDRRRARKGPPSLQSGITSLVLGIGFLVAALALMLDGQGWGIFLLFPAIPNVARGIGAIVAARQMGYWQGQAPPQMAPPGVYSKPAIPAPPNSAPVNSVPSESAPRTGELYEDPSRAVLQPPSVTEGTTRIMNHNPESFREKV